MERAGAFYLRHLWLPLAGALFCAWLIEITRLDWHVSNRFFDPLAMRFPLRDNVFLEFGMHHVAKYVVVAFALGVAALALAAFLHPPWRRYRRVLVFLVLALGLSSAAVSALKTLTGHHCPWDLTVYGGSMPFFGVLEARPDGVPPGRCWPSGHASTGFCLFGLYFAARWTGRRRLAAGTLAAALTLGFVFGLGRVAQGAHFLSHNLWSATVCWLVTLILYELLLRRRNFDGFP
jgi:membrane-associated PAP2 superfamily phosphatase